MIIVGFCLFTVGVMVSKGVRACIAPGHQQGCSIQNSEYGPCHNPRATCVVDFGTCRFRDGEKCNKETYQWCLNGSKCTLVDGSCYCQKGVQEHSFLCTVSPECIPTGCDCNNALSLVVSDITVGEKCSHSYTTAMCPPLEGNGNVVKATSTETATTDVMYCDSAGQRLPSFGLCVTWAAFVISLVAA